MVRNNKFLDNQINDVDRYSDLVMALQDADPAIDSTPFGAQKTAEMDVQFSLDPSYGLTKERYGWFSNGVLFDSTHFSEDTGKIRMETSATSGDIARLRSAFPGQYTAHTLAEPGIGARIPEQHVEYDDNNRVSLTHGEISFEVAQWSDTSDASITAHGISYESDGVYAQIRSEGNDVEFVPQENWNIDPLDGTGPSEHVLEPERGYIYIFFYTWYGEGSYILAVQSSSNGELYPAHKYPALTGANPSLDAPNMPVQATVENKTTADPLTAVIGGMAYATHGSIDEDISRTTEESRWTTNGTIASTAALTNNAIDPFTEPGYPLVAIRRDVNSTRSEKGLKFTIEDLFIDADQDVFLFIFDEYNEGSALTGASFSQPESRGNSEESQLQTDTQATAYTPSSDAVLRGIAYGSTSQKEIQEITGDTTSNVPLQSTAVITAALAPGSNATDAQPFLVEATERF